MISDTLNQSLSVYNQFGKALIQLINTKSLSSLSSILPGILSSLGGDSCGGDFETYCPSGGSGGNSGGNSGGVVGAAGDIDWQAASDSIDTAVKTATAAADGKFNPNNDDGPISSGITDKRFRPRVTTIASATKVASWAKLQDAQLKIVLGAEGQQFTQDERADDAKIVQEASKNTAEIQKLDNTQDVMKKSQVSTTLGLAMQQRSMEQLRQIKKSTWEGNQTQTQQLSLQQKQDWEKEVERSQARKSAYTQGQAFADFIDSAYSK